MFFCVSGWINERCSLCRACRPISCLVPPYSVSPHNGCRDNSYEHDLMGSSSLKLQCHRGHVVICTCDVKMSNSLLAVWRYRPFNNTVRMSANRSIDCSLHLCHPPVNHCCIPAFHKAVFCADDKMEWANRCLATSMTPDVSRSNRVTR